MEASWRKEYARYRGFFLNIALVTQKRQDVKMFLEIILTVSTIIIFTVFALKPTLMTIAEVVKEIQYKEEVIAKMDEKLADLNSAQIAANENQEEIALLDTAVPKGADPDILARQIEAGSYGTTASLEGISVEEVVLKGKAKAARTNNDQKALPEGAKSLSLNFSAKGEYLPIKDFLTFIETMRRPLMIDNLSIAAKKADEAIEDVLSSLTITVAGQAPYLDESQPETTPEPAEGGEE